MDTRSLPDYLDAAARLQGLHLSAEQREATLVQLERFAAVAATFLDLPLGPDDEPIESVRP